jgi:hypothetical protein
MRMKGLRLGVAVLVTASLGFFAYHRVATIRDRYKEVPVTASAEKGSLQAVNEMSKQNELFLNWAVLLLAGSLGLLTAREPLEIRGVEWAYTLFTGPPAILLLASAWTGWKFKARLTYLLTANRDDWMSLNALLTAQARFFLLALVLLSLLGAWIVAERISRPLTGAKELP